jgi:hypothetical protein
MVDFKRILAEQHRAADAALARCEELLDSIDELPSPAIEFGESVAEGVRAVMERIEKDRRVTPKQQQAIDNWAAGVAAWFHG